MVWDDQPGPFLHKLSRISSHANWAFVRVHILLNGSSTVKTNFLLLRVQKGCWQKIPLQKPKKTPSAIFFAFSMLLTVAFEQRLSVQNPVKDDFFSNSVIEIVDKISISFLWEVTVALLFGIQNLNLIQN